MLKLITLAALPILASTSAQASTAPGAKEVSFRYMTSDLQSGQGIASLHQRLRDFARQECASGVIYLIPIEEKCRREIESQLVRKIGDERLARAANTKLD